MAETQAVALRSKVIHDLENVQKELLAMRDKAHILTPFCRSSVPYIPEGWNVFIHQYTISLAQDEKGEFKDGEVYLIKENGRLALTKIGLWRLEQLAGVTWEDPKTGKSTIVRIDDGKDSLVCRYQATGFILDIDGQRRSQSDGFGYDLRDNSPQANALSDKPKNLARLRQNIEQQTITKAKLRVLRGLLGVQSSYKPNDLLKPFVVLRMAFNIDAIDPTIKNKLITIMAAKQMGIEKEVFGLMQLEADQARQLEAMNPTPPPPLPPVVEPLKLGEPGPIDDEASYLEPDEDADRMYWAARDAQIERITKLYQSKKGKSRDELSPGKPPLRDLPDQELTAIEDALSQLPNL